ncbi:MAG: circadian clock protein KaiC [Ktedonobacteraceae bacterium]
MTEGMYSQPALVRVESGMRGLDTLLAGGFLKGGIYLIMGPPGAGKTVLGNQLCFHHVASGERAVYVTLLAETHARMLAHIQSMQFFRPEAIADTLYYVSGYSVLEQEGLTGLMKLLREVCRTQRATLLVVDGLLTAEEVAPSPLEFKHFVHGLHTYMETLGCTTFLLTQFDGADYIRPEFIMVDGLIELTDRVVDMRAVREIQIHKFRGSRSLRGKHLFEITDAGFSVHPRTETLYALSPVDRANSSISTDVEQRVAFGVPRFDEMMQGGVAPDSTTLLLGAAGTGKTLLGLHFLTEGARRGEKGLLFGLHETPTQLINKADRLGLPTKSYVESGQITIFRPSAPEDIIDVMAEQILEIVQRQQIRRLLIDGIDGFQRAISSQERLGLFLTALTSELQTRQVTTVCTVELTDMFNSTLRIPIPGGTGFADNLFFLRYIELRSQLYRLISIIKMRDSGYDTSIREFRISDQGIEVSSTFESAEAILTGKTLPAEDRGPLPSAGSFPDQEKQS